MSTLTAITPTQYRETPEATLQGRAYAFLWVVGCPVLPTHAYIASSFRVDDLIAMTLKAFQHHVYRRTVVCGYVVRTSAPTVFGIATRKNIA